MVCPETQSTLARANWQCEGLKKGDGHDAARGQAECRSLWCPPKLGTFRSDTFAAQRTIAATRLNAESTRCIISGTAVIANRTTCRPGE